VTLVSRRAGKAGKDGRRPPAVVRGISNEPQVLQMLQSFVGVEAHLVDLSSLSLADQLDLVVDTDILIGEPPLTALTPKAENGSDCPC
jgi:hypothetical protein